MKKNWNSLIYPLKVLIRWLRRWLTEWKIDLITNRYSINNYRYSREEYLLFEMQGIESVRIALGKSTWIEQPIPLISGSIDSKYLSVLLQILSDLQPNRICEFGGGVSSKYLAQYSRKFDVSALTVEHDEGWVKVLNQDSHSNYGVHHAALTAYSSVLYGEFHWYKDPPIPLNPESKDFWLLLVDGPVGTDRFSRIGFVPWSQTKIPENWIVLWDDLQRPGDLESFGEFLQVLRANDIQFEHKVIPGIKQFGIVCSPNNRVALYKI